MSTHINGNGSRLSGLEIFNKIEGRKASRLFVKGDSALIGRLRSRIEAAPFNLTIAEDPREARGSVIRISTLEGRPLMEAAHIIMSDEFHSLDIVTDEPT